MWYLKPKLYLTIEQTISFSRSIMLREKFRENDFALKVFSKIRLLLKQLI